MIVPMIVHVALVLRKLQFSVRFKPFKRSMECFNMSYKFGVGFGSLFIQYLKFLYFLYSVNKFITFSFTLFIGFQDETKFYIGSLRLVWKDWKWHTLSIGQCITADDTVLGFVYFFIPWFAYNCLHPVYLKVGGKLFFIGNHTSSSYFYVSQK